jgi:hypothetical protein
MNEPQFIIKHQIFVKLPPPFTVLYLKGQGKGRRGREVGIYVPILPAPHPDTQSHPLRIQKPTLCKNVVKLANVNVIISILTSTFLSRLARTFTQHKIIVR